MGGPEDLAIQYVRQVLDARRTDVHQELTAPGFTETIGQHKDLIFDREASRERVEEQSGIYSGGLRYSVERHYVTYSQAIVIWTLSVGDADPSFRGCLIAAEDDGQLSNVTIFATSALGPMDGVSEAFSGSESELDEFLDGSRVEQHSVILSMPFGPGTIPTIVCYCPNDNSHPTHSKVNAHEPTPPCPIENCRAQRVCR